MFPDGKSIDTLKDTNNSNNKEEPDLLCKSGSSFGQNNDKGNIHEKLENGRRNN